VAEAVRILLVEDSVHDAELVQRELARAGLACAFRRVDSEPALREALREFEPALVISDFSMPGFDGLSALAICKESGGDVPFLFMSGTVGEDVAVDAMRAGADDYVMKSNLVRLAPAVRRCLRDAEGRERRRVAELALRRAHSMAKLAYVVTGRDGSFESWSDSFPQLAGIGPEAMPGNTREWLALVHPGDREIFRHTSIEAARRGGRMSVQYRLRHADGSWVHVRQVMEPLPGARDAKGRTRWFGTLLDVTAQEQASAELRASEERYRATFEQAAVGVVHTSLAGEVLVVNPKFCDLTGYTRADAVQRSIRDLAHPGDIAASLEDRERILSRRGESRVREFRLVRKDGSSVWVSMTTSLALDREDRPSHFISVIHDVSERRRAEEEARRFRAAIDASVDSIYITDLESMRFLYVNEVACRRLGYERARLLEMGPLDVLKVDPEALRRDYERVIAAGERGMRTESRFVRSDGSEGWTEIHRRAVQTEGGRVLVTLGRDVTDRKRAEAELLESEARFRSLTQLSSDWYWEQDSELRFTSFTGGEGDAKWGPDQTGQIGKRRWEIAGILPLSTSWDEHRALLEARKSFRDFEYARDTAEGTRYVASSGEPVFDGDGRFRGYRGTARDITEHRRGEEALRRFRLALDNSPDLVLIIDRATMRHVDVNETACRLLGYSRQELLAMGPGDILPLDRAALEQKYDELIANPEQPSGMTSYYRCKDGSRLAFESTRRVLRAGDRWLIVAISRDIRARLAAENALRESEERFRQLAENVDAFFYLTDLQNTSILYASPAYERIWGRSLASLHAAPRSWADALHPEDRTRVLESFAHSSDRATEREYRIVLADGGVRDLRSRSFPVPDASGRPYRIAGIVEDVTARKSAEERIRRLNRVYAVLSGINGAIVRIRDRHELCAEACRIAVDAGRFAFAWLGFVNRSEQRINVVASAGRDEGFLDTARSRLSLRDDAPDGAGPPVRAVKSGQPFVVNDVESDPRVRYKREHADRGIRAFAMLPLMVEGEAIGVLSLHAADAGYFDAEEMKLLRELAGDISFALEHIEKSERADYLSYYDELTGLANRRLFLERLGQYSIATGQAQGMLAVVLLDLERLRAVNESLGRQAGDAVLRDIARRLGGDTEKRELGRISADHFAVVLKDVRGRSEVVRKVERLWHATFDLPLSIDLTDVRVSARAGIALYPKDGTDAETLLGYAEAAVRHAKKRGERFVFYEAVLTERSAETLSLETKLRRALERKEFVLHYQPKVDAPSSALVGLEALIRWQSPELGLVPPGKFIGLMEETGMILEAGYWALAQAAADHARWVAMGLAAPRVAVNVSSVQLRKDDFVESVRRAIGGDAMSTGIDLEITESLMMEDVQGNIDKLRAIRNLGMSVAIDDFGTGYSSLGYLSRLPVQALKIDRSFIITMLKEPDTMTLVRTIVSLAHSLKLTVVAEGVDDEEQAKALRTMKCDQIQGYLTGRPVPFDEITALLKSAAARGNAHSPA
jgi:PAS domain S-box-containing protein/diguanylate cyclase (GGDEF)-like protein